MSSSRAMQRLCGLMRKAVQDYEMIAPGDRVMVGVSGGKDSVALTIGLSMLRKYIGFDYEVVAVTLDPQFDHQPMDYSALAELFRVHGIPYEVRRTEIGPVVFEYRKEKNPCALCAKLRRGALHTAAQELACNKVALGHHLDDAVETFYMNLWREGRIGCFSPVTYLSQRDLTLIRPMLLATEYEVQCAVREAGLPIVKSRCPADGVTVREQTKEFVQERCRTVSNDFTEEEAKNFDCDMLVFFSPTGIKAFTKNFPDFKQGEVRIATFGPTTAKAVADEGFRLDLEAPTKEHPSMTSALRGYLENIK